MNPLYLCGPTDACTRVVLVLAASLPELDVCLGTGRIEAGRVLPIRDRGRRVEPVVGDRAEVLRPVHLDGLPESQVVEVIRLRLGLDGEP